MTTFTAPEITTTDRTAHVHAAVLGLVKIITTPNDVSAEALRPSIVGGLERLAPEVNPVKLKALREELDDRYSEAQKDIQAGVLPKDSLGGLALAIVALGGN